MAELPIKFQTLVTNDDRRIGVATLNAPRSLNALSLEMIDLLSDKLADWAVDPEIVVVWLEGAGDKAFCAGGDVVGLYRAITGASGDDDFPTRYFTAEYRLDFLQAGDVNRCCDCNGFPPEVRPHPGEDVSKIVFVL